MTEILSRNAAFAASLPVLHSQISDLGMFPQVLAYPIRRSLCLLMPFLFLYQKKYSAVRQLPVKYTSAYLSVKNFSMVIYVLYYPHCFRRFYHLYYLYCLNFLFLLQCYPSLQSIFRRILPLRHLQSTAVTKKQILYFYADLSTSAALSADILPQNFYQFNRLLLAF